MRFMLMHYSNEANEADTPPSPELVAEMGAFMEETARSGVLLAAEGVRSSRHGARLTITDTEVTVTDGPFAEAKEQLAGFFLFDFATRERAEEVAARFAGPGDTVELRPAMQG